MPLISVVIPLYNKEMYIKRAVNSVLSQKIQKFELIIVDDGSTDKSVEIIKNITDKRIRVIQQQNSGVSAARNKGIKEANADLIAFLDADDEWLPNFLETIMRLRILHPDAGIYGTGYEVYFPGSIVKRFFKKDEGERILASYFGSTVNFGHTLFNSSSFASPKDVLIEVGGYPHGVKWNEDGALWGKIALNYPVSYSPIICSIYHQYSANNSTGITDYLENPFISYISTISKNELLKKDDVYDLMEYMDLSYIATISRNIYSGHGIRARKQISKVTSPRYKWKKYQLRIMSYTPYWVMRFILKNASTLSYFKKKVFCRNP
jgi:glycosyltransferase involved in cell wall biosynthesis